jgi:hypothetical protein
MSRNVQTLLRRTVATAMFAWACLLSESAAADEHIHPSLARGPRTISNILILPPQVAILRVGMRGGELRTEQAAQLEHDLAELIDRAARERVFGATTMPVVAAKAEDRYTLADLQSRYDRIAEVMHRKRRGVNTGRYSLTDAVQSVKGAEPGTVLMFTRFTAVTTTLAAVLLQHAEGELFLAFADATTGDILFLSQRKVAFGTNTGQILGQLRQSFKKIPRERFANTEAPSEWAVIHIHPFGQCDGWLYVAADRMGFRSLTSKDHAWDVPLTDVADVADALGYGFQVTLVDGRTFRLTGRGIAKDQLLSLIDASRK